MYETPKIEIPIQVGEECHLIVTCPQPNMNAIDISICSIITVLSSELSRDASFMEVLTAVQKSAMVRKAMEIAKDIVSNMDIEHSLPSRTEMKRVVASFGDVISYSYSDQASLKEILENLNEQEIKDMVAEF